MNRILAIAALSLAIAVPALAADHSPYRRHDRERVANHWEQQGDRIDARLDREADRVERRFEHRADRAEALGNERLADHLRARGERIARHLDRKGDRIEARFDRRGELLARNFDHRNAPLKSYRNHGRHEHVYGQRHHDRWCGEQLSLRLDGLGIFWSHRH